MQGIQARFQLSWPGFSLDVDLNLPGKGVMALFGHSGSGKTSFLRCIAGLEPNAHGRVCVNGDIWQDNHLYLPTHQRSLGYVFQEASLLPHLSVLGNLRYGQRRISAAHRVSLDQAITLLGIDHLLDRKPEHLSGGERSRVAIARALAVNPRILLMDEPLAALDLKRKKEILPYLERLHNELDIPILYVSHAAEEVARLADYLVVMENGRVLASGSLEETLTRIDLPIHLGEDVGVILNASIGEIDHVWHLARVDFQGGSLWARDQGLLVGHRVRVRILARDLSLVRDFPAQSSIQNVLRGRVEQIADDEHPGLSLVRVQIGASLFIARITKRALASLSVVVGEELWVQIKSVALME